MKCGECDSKNTVKAVFNGAEVVICKTCGAFEWCVDNDVLGTWKSGGSNNGSDVSH
jgi:hypothetical protein